MWSVFTDYNDADKQETRHIYMKMVVVFLWHFQAVVGALRQDFPPEFGNKLLVDYIFLNAPYRRLYSGYLSGDVFQFRLKDMS